MARMHVSQLTATILCVVGTSLFLFVCTFRNEDHQEGTQEQIKEGDHLSSYIPRIHIAQGQIQRNLTLSKSRFHTNISHIFEQQAHTRKELFEKALHSTNPSVSSVLLPLVPEVFCPSLVRVGYVGDGGKWVCNPWAMPRGGAVFSLGSHNDISFESDFQQITGSAAHIITVDMTEASESALIGLARIKATFVHAMIDSKTITSPSSPSFWESFFPSLFKFVPHYTVADLMKKMNYDTIEILKMDIEGSEVSVLPQFLQKNSVCQILVEIHDIVEVPKILRAVANAGFLLQKYELNAYWTGKGLCEYSFIHENCLKQYGATKLASYLKQ